MKKLLLALAVASLLAVGCVNQQATKYTCSDGTVVASMADCPPVNSVITPIPSTASPAPLLPDTIPATGGSEDVPPAPPALPE